MVLFATGLLGHPDLVQWRINFNPSCCGFGHTTRVPHHPSHTVQILWPRRLGSLRKMAIICKLCQSCPIRPTHCTSRPLRFNGLHLLHCFHHRHSCCFLWFQKQLQVRDRRESVLHCRRSYILLFVQLVRSTIDLDLYLLYWFVCFGHHPTSWCYLLYHGVSQRIQRMEKYSWRSYPWRNQRWHNQEEQVLSGRTGWWSP